MALLKITHYDYVYWGLNFIGLLDGEESDGGIYYFSEKRKTRKFTKWTVEIHHNKGQANR